MFHRSIASQTIQIDFASLFFTTLKARIILYFVTPETEHNKAYKNKAIYLPKFAILKRTFR